MITGLSSLIFVPLLAVSMVHLLWAFGSAWPVNDEKILARTVAGFKNIEKMPPRLASLSVAVLVFGAGVIGLALSDPAPNLSLTLLGAASAMVFLARGAIGFSSKWAEITPEEPFRTLDRKVYSPLCLGIGACFLGLVLWRLL